MIEDELDETLTENILAESLTQYKQAVQEEARLISAYNKARNEDRALIQAEEEVEELDNKYCKANKTWRELNNKFNKKHEALLKSLKEAHRVRYQAANDIDLTYRKITGDIDEW